MWSLLEARKRYVACQEVVVCVGFLFWCLFAASKFWQPCKQTFDHILCVSAEHAFNRALYFKLSFSLEWAYDQERTIWKCALPHYTSCCLINHSFSCICCICLYCPGMWTLRGKHVNQIYAGCPDWPWLHSLFCYNKSILAFWGKLGISLSLNFRTQPGPCPQSAAHWCHLRTCCQDAFYMSASGLFGLRSMGLNPKARRFLPASLICPQWP